MDLIKSVGVVVPFLVVIVVGIMLMGRRESTDSEDNRNIITEDQKEAWLAHCVALDEWYEANKRRFTRSDLNSKQIKILYAFAEVLDYSSRLELWQLLMIWDWDETGPDRLRFDVDFEKMRSRGLLIQSGGCTSLPQMRRKWILSQKGRNLLLKHKII
ncbi:MAG: hypothetical protein AAB365_00985 [Patescibacteria group bacterium]